MVLLQKQKRVRLSKHLRYIVKPMPLTNHQIRDKTNVKFRDCFQRLLIKPICTKLKAGIISKRHQGLNISPLTGRVSCHQIPVSENEHGDGTGQCCKHRKDEG